MHYAYYNITYYVLPNVHYILNLKMTTVLVES